MRNFIESFKKMSLITAFILLVILIALSFLFKNIILDAKIEAARKIGQDNMKIEKQNDDKSRAQSNNKPSTSPGIDFQLHSPNEFIDNLVPDETVEPAFNKAFSEALGKKLIINFWADWNIPSKNMLDEIYKATKLSGFPSANIAILCINVTPNSNSPVNHLTSRNYPFISLKDNLGVIMNKYQVDVIPSTVFMDSTQKGSSIIKGKMTADEILKYVSLLK